MLQQSDYQQAVQTIEKLDHSQKVKLLEELGKMIQASTVDGTRGNGRKPSWLGCLADKTDILGDIIEPAVDAAQWEALAE